MNQYETRKLPKKTIIIIGILIFTSIAGFLLIMLSKQVKIEEVLNSFGYKSISNVIVYNASEVLDEKTNRNGELYKIGFTNKDTNQECKGLVFRLSGKYEIDIDCK